MHRTSTSCRLASAVVWSALGLGPLTGCGATTTSDDGAGAGADEPVSASGGATASGGSKRTGDSGAATGGTTSNGSGGASKGSGGSASGGSSAGGGATGGSGGATGGSGGTGGSVNHTVGACDNLGAVGQFESVTPSGVSVVLNIQIDPNHGGTLYAGTEKAGIYKTTNCGADWTMVSTGQNGDLMNTHQNWSLLVSRTEPGVLFSHAFYSSDPSLMKSTDGGVDWASTTPAGSNVAQAVEYNFFQWAAMDRDDSRHLVVSYHANCTGAYAPMCLGETTDSGATWRLFKGPTNGWSEAASPHILSHSTWLFVTYADGIFYTSDAGATWSRVGGGGYAQDYLSANGTLYLASAYGVQRSTDMGKSFTGVGPSGTAVIGDGTRLFVGKASPENGNVFYASPETGTLDFQPMPGQNMTNGANSFAYDPDHHVLFSASGASGIYRVVTK